MNHKVEKNRRVPTLCKICKHRASYTTCKAFPDEIPKEFCNLDGLHFEKHPSQKNDIVFEFYEIEHKAPFRKKEALELLKIFTELHKQRKAKKVAG